jgi:hypothetical protein
MAAVLPGFGRHIGDFLSKSSGKSDYFPWFPHSIMPPCGVCSDRD